MTSRPKSSGRIQTLLTVALVAISIGLSLWPRVDEIGSHHVDEAFKRALVGFALARGLNGVISVAQGTEVAVQPAGVGVNFTPGQILDPVNDLIERFSWIMLLATSSLGIQKILLAMSAWNGLLIALVACGSFYILAMLVMRLSSFRATLARLFLFVLILRFMMPAISVANEWVYQTFLQENYETASQSLEEARVAIGSINDAVMQEREQQPENLLERARRVYERALDSVNLDKRLTEYKQAAESISENTIQLVVVFLMQTLVFPLIFLTIVMGVIRRLTRARLM